MLLAAFLLVVVAAVSGDLSFCWYATYPNGQIVVADGNCTLAGTVCATTNQCDRSSPTTFTSTVLTNCTGLGRLKNYAHSSLTIKDVPRLIFDNVTTIIDLYTTSVSHWPSVSTIVLRDNNLTDTSSIGATLTTLDISSNTLRRMTNNDFGALKALSFSNNWDLTTIANVSFAKIAFLNMTNCWHRSNMTLDATSYEALNALRPWNDSSAIDAPTGYSINYPIATDAIACNDVGGSIQKLWESTSTISVAVCVTATAATTTSDNYYASLVMGVTCGTAFVAAAIIFFYLSEWQL
ncbi:hypothetical protein SDRG_16498 [Saprolegnia diclina VS20]|uniref:Uncharacterized protein n=1 Tax=Saprolegnia diclina (strain VS20) TaxID=1156394 RepID=T0R0X8_SAPDV|nr:hypothetical protein SDRG_16498 [Saprolegnia diclina VS20]EQC25643.1 hypothetical protein SDRG_16498 [Saprolegnia diclina VS20]|eukprot:XP_008620934.1 hypothetical protein SDRG_16498 [Saprolegnia diclina VS20]